MDVKEIFQLHELAMAEAKKYTRSRFLLKTLKQLSGKYFVGLVGPRGVGKSILLKQWASHFSSSIYISVDTLKNESVFDLVKKLVEDYKIKHVFLDEVHFYPHINEELKKIYDFLRVRIFFTSSVALAMNQSEYDLSRRVRLFYLYPFNFREYLYFKAGVELRPLSIQDIYYKKWDSAHLKYEHHFENFLRGGIYPFSLEEPEPLPLLQNILHKIIHDDIPAVSKLYVEELDAIKKMVEFMGKAPVDGINYTSLSKNIGISKYKAEQYTNLLCQAFVLLRLMPKGTQVIKEPKILMHLPYRLLFQDYDQAIGALREDFVVSMLKSSGLNPYYLKSTRGEKTPDFAVPWDDGKKNSKEDVIVEVGGKGKGRVQFKDFSTSKKIIFAHTADVDDVKRPLFLCGFLEQ